MRDAIVFSGWTWEAFNVPERIALALRGVGARVLYCEHPVSFLRQKGRPLAEIERGIYRVGFEILGPRFNRIPLLPHLQAKLIVRQLLEHAAQLRLENPLFVYPHGEWILPVCEKMKRKGFILVHVCMDYPEPGQDALAHISDSTLVIPKAAFDAWRVRFGTKVHKIPQSFRWNWRPELSNGSFRESEELAGIPRPRMGYLGPVENRLNLQLLRDLLAANPDWQFISFGTAKRIALPNAHVLHWREAGELPALVSGLDMGLMPYDCASPKNLHCVPLKLFDYFAAGLPVVATPIVYLRQFEGLVYLGETPAELARAVSCAMREPADSPKRVTRRRVARAHSIESLSRRLERILPLQEGTV